MAKPAHPLTWTQAAGIAATWAFIASILGFVAGSFAKDVLGLDIDPWKSAQYFAFVAGAMIFSFLASKLI